MEHRITVEDFLLEFRSRPATKVAYSAFLRYFDNWLIQAHPDLDLDDLRPAHFQEFLTSRDWSGSTPYHCACALRAYIRWAFGKRHPFLKLKVHRPDPGPQRTLTQDEVERLYSSIDTTTRAGARDLPMVMLMLDTGLRASEVASLLLRNVELENRTLSVEGKGGRWRTSVFSPATKAYLEDWINGAREDLVQPGVQTLFVSAGGLRPGTPLTKDGLRSVFRYMGKRADVKNLSPHVMRRTFATLAIRNGAPSRLVQVAGGWSNLAMVERYTRALDPRDFDGYWPTNALVRGKGRPSRAVTQEGH